jgi:hypothetical protein
MVELKQPHYCSRTVVDPPLTPPAVSSYDITGEEKKKRKKTCPAPPVPEKPVVELSNCST